MGYSVIQHPSSGEALLVGSGRGNTSTNEAKVRTMEHRGKGLMANRKLQTKRVTDYVELAGPRRYIVGSAEARQGSERD